MVYGMETLVPICFFVLVAADVLNRMLQHSFDKGFLYVLNLKGGLNHIGYLQFADDTLIISRALDSDIAYVKLIRYIFEQVFGLSINFSKSFLFSLERMHHKKLGTFHAQ